jgi:hypothetical protein
MKKAVFGFLAVALLLATAFPVLAAPAPSAAPAGVPVWLAGLTPAVGAGLDFLPKPFEMTACSQPDRAACTMECRQECSPCHSGGGTCTLENGCVCNECLCH